MFRSPGAIALHLGPLEIRWYGILTAASIALGLWLADRQARAENLPAEEISRCAWWAVAPGYATAELFHPTFLYESLWDLGLFVLLVSWLRPRFRSRPGVLFFSYIGLYSVGRFAIEALRLDSFWVGEFRVAQLASLVGMAFAAGGVPCGGAGGGR